MGAPETGLVLAFDTSGDPASACLVGPAGVPDVRVAAPGSRAGEALHPLLRDLLEAAGTTPPALALVGVVRGPGSFTGLRVGLSAAAGLRLAAGVPVGGVETTRAIAQASGGRGEILVVLDGGQGRHFVGIHRREDSVAVPVEGPLDLAPADVLERIAARRGVAIWRGPDGPDGRAFVEAGCEPFSGPLAPAVAELARIDGPSPDATEAIYARAPAIRPAAPR